jgi:hypothetical protein
MKRKQPSVWMPDYSWVEKDKDDVAPTKPKPKRVRLKERVTAKEARRILQITGEQYRELRHRRFFPKPDSYDEDDKPLWFRETIDAFKEEDLDGPYSVDQILWADYANQ